MCGCIIDDLINLHGLVFIEAMTNRSFLRSTGSHLHCTCISNLVRRYMNHCRSQCTFRF